MRGVRLRVDVYDALAHMRGLHDPLQQAVFHRRHLSTIYRLRAGRLASLPVAMGMARDFDVTVETLFEQVP